MPPTFRRAAALALLTAAAPLTAPAQDDPLATCRQLGIMGFVQQLIDLRGFEQTNVLEFCDDYNGLHERLDLLEANLEAAERQLPPDDAILLIDDSEGCPDGWRDMASDEPAKFAARMALAAIQSDDPENPYLYRETHGAATHTLRPGEMPAHTHIQRVGQHRISGEKIEAMDLKGFGGVYTTSATTSMGGSRPHNNMPPYIALYFCKKDAG